MPSASSATPSASTTTQPTPTRIVSAVKKTPARTTVLHNNGSFTRRELSYLNVTALDTPNAVAVDIASKLREDKFYVISELAISWLLLVQSAPSFLEKISIFIKDSVDLKVLKNVETMLNFFVQNWSKKLRPSFVERDRQLSYQWQLWPFCPCQKIHLTVILSTCFLKTGSKWT